MGVVHFATCYEMITFYTTTTELYTIVELFDEMLKEFVYELRCERLPFQDWWLARGPNGVCELIDDTLVSGNLLYDEASKEPS